MKHLVRDKKIGILLHEFDEFSDTRGPLVSHLAVIWRDMGIEVSILKGTNGTSSGVDLLIPHINLTVIPAGLIEYINTFPMVLNRGLTDISKRAVSSNLVSADSSYDGQVIVKTNLNYGGIPEHNFDFKQGKFPVHAHDVQRPWRKVKMLSPSDYPIFERISRVPNGVWKNKNLVVEKFIPEREDEFYCMHISQVMGSVCATKRLYSLAPIIKGSTIVRSEVVETPQGIHEIRSKFGMDYGKLDYVVHDGHIDVLDINKTPGSPPTQDYRPEWVSLLAQAVGEFL